MDHPERFVLTSMDVARVDGYRAQHRISLLTVLFSDIVGYTTLCEQHSEFEMLRFRSDFDALSAECVEQQHSGLLIKRMGDAILAIFAEPSIAVLAAIHLHEAISNQVVA